MQENSELSSLSVTAMDQDEYPESGPQLSPGPSECPKLSTPVSSASAFGSSSVIPDKALHPMLSFPFRTFGKQRRSFCSSWYLKYP